MAVVGNSVTRCVIVTCQHNTFFVIGLCIGITLSLLLTPLFEEECLLNDNMKSDFDQSGRYVRNKLLDNEDYEPRINLAGKPKKAQKTPQVLLRPRYYSTELGIKEKLFIGVLTSQQTIQTLGTSFNKTVTHHVNKVVFFLDAVGPQKFNVSMPGIVGFTDTRKILKPFHVLKYIVDTFLEDYDFFFIVPDSTFVKGRKLQQLVSKISVGEDVHVGTPVEDEHAAYCSLEGGLLLSHSVLKLVGVNLEWCVKNAFSESDEDNVGRCILHSVSLPCTKGIQGQTFESFLLQDGFNFDHAIDTLSKSEFFKNAVAVYPVQDEQTIFKLHRFFSKVELEEKNKHISALQDSIVNMSYIAPGGRGAVTWPVGSQPASKPATRFDVNRWDYVTESLIYLDSDFSNVRKLSQAEKADIQYVLNASLTTMLSKYEGQLQYRRLVNGYRRFDQSRGMDYIFDLAFRVIGSGLEVHKRVEVSKSLGKVEIVPVPYVTENSRVHLVLPVESKERNMAMNFITEYARVCMERKDKTFLLMAFLYDPTDPGKGYNNDTFGDLKAAALSLSERFKRDGLKVAWISIRTRGIRPTDFAIVDLVVRKLTADSLILLCRPNMEIRQDYLNRVRMNTISLWQVFSPIPFAEFHPDIVYIDSHRQKELEINKNFGHYNTLNYNHISFYGRDYLAARKQIEMDVPIIKSDREIISGSGGGVNGETHFISLYSMFVRSSNVHVMRAVEPSLRLWFQKEECSPSLPTQTYQHCLLERSENLGTRAQLANVLLKYQTSRLKNG